MKSFYSFVSQVCHCLVLVLGLFCIYIYICLPGLSLLVSALFCWRCNISIHSFVCLRDLPLLVFCWPCSISIHASPSSVAAGVRLVSHLSPLFPVLFLAALAFPFLLVIVSVLFVTVSALSSFLSPSPPCLPSCLPLSPVSIVVVLVGHCVGLVSLLFPFVSLLVFALLVGHCVRFVSLLFAFVSLLVSLLVGHCVRLVSLLFLVSLLGGHCVRLVSLLVSLLVGHCVRFFSFCLTSSPVLSRFLLAFLFPFLLVIVSVLSPFPFVALLVPLCLRSCLPSWWSLCPSCLPSCLPSCWPLCPSCLPSLLFLCLQSCLPSCWALCPSCLPSVSSPFLSPLSPLLFGHCVRLVFLLSSCVPPLFLSHLQRICLPAPLQCSILPLSTHSFHGDMVRPLDADNSTLLDLARCQKDSGQSQSSQGPVFMEQLRTALELVLQCYAISGAPVWQVCEVMSCEIV